MTDGALLEGRVWKFGDHIDTDCIIPARYLVSTDGDELKKHCMEALDPTFPTKVKAGDIIVAGKNFGCGSSREHAPLAIKALGISCIIAFSFARIFYRNAFNMALPLFECPLLSQEASSADILRVDMAKGLITNLTQGKAYQTSPLPPFMLQLLEAGGLLHWLMKDV